MSVSDFIEIKPDKISDNVFKLIGDDWMLITAGKLDDFNTMTASWGGMGILWHKPVVYCFVRPQRHTFQFMEKYKDFTLTFFEEKYRDALKYCGTKSGKDVDKAKETGLIPYETKNGNVFFKQARLIIECHKLYYNDIDPLSFLDPGIIKNYPVSDYHRMYIGEIKSCLLTSEEIK